MARKQASTPRKSKRAERKPDLVVITGLSGSGKGSVLRALEDLGFYSVDNLPVDLIPKFAELTRDNPSIQAAALVVDIREGERLKRFPQAFAGIRRSVNAKLIFLEADDEAIVRRFSETRRPHPLGTSAPVKTALAEERKQLRSIRRIADLVIDTSKFNVHELRAHMTERFEKQSMDRSILVSCVSFGYRQGVPEEADLVFDVRFLPNPHFVAEFRPFTGKNPRVAKYIRSFPQTQEFITRISELLIYLLPHYIREGKSYLTIAFGCTGGQHRSVFIAEQVQKRLARAGYRTKVMHRDAPK